MIEVETRVRIHAEIQLSQHQIEIVFLLLRLRLLSHPTTEKHTQIFQVAKLNIAIHLSRRFTVGTRGTKMEINFFLISSRWVQPQHVYLTVTVSFSALTAPL